MIKSNPKTMLPHVTTQRNEDLKQLMGKYWNQQSKIKLLEYLLEQS